MPVEKPEIGLTPIQAGDDPLQREVLFAYLSLARKQRCWASRLILIVAGPGQPVTPLQYAGLVAGALSLTLSPDGDELKQGLRQGAFDFLVNTPDEALRILKNEARKGSPISVALLTEPGGAALELLRRGLAPALLATAKAALLPAEAVPDDIPRWAGGTEADTKSALPPSGALVYCCAFRDAITRRRFDEEAASLLQGNPVGTMAGWLNRIGRVLPRSRSLQRLLVLSPEEVEIIGRAFPELTATSEL